MKLGKQDLQNLKDIAIAAAKYAGKLIATYTGKEMDVIHKIAGSSEASKVVTAVDLKSQDFILEHISPTLDQYNLGLLAEESEDNGGRLSKDYFWSIDPLDGTLPFIEGVPGYAISIALVSRSGESILGVVYDPVERNLYHAIKGEGAFLNNQFWQPEKSKHTFTFITDRSFLKHPDHDRMIDSLKGMPLKSGYTRFNISSQGGAVMNAIWVMEKAPAVYFKLPKKQIGGGSLWDFAATACIVNEVGGIASDMQGNPLDLNRAGSTFMNHRGVLYASDKAVTRILE